MDLFQFSGKRKKVFIILSIIFLAPLVLMFVPFFLVKILALIPAMFIISIPGILFAVLQVPGFDIQEFGAVPEGVLAWSLVVLFWVVAAFFLSLIKTKE